MQSSRWPKRRETRGPFAKLLSDLKVRMWVASHDKMWNARLNGKMALITLLNSHLSVKKMHMYTYTHTEMHINIFTHRRMSHKLKLVLGLFGCKPLCL